MLQNLKVFRLEVLDISHFSCFYCKLSANFESSSYKIIFTRFSSLLLANILAAKHLPKRCAYMRLVISNCKGTNDLQTFHKSSDISTVIGMKPKRFSSFPNLSYRKRSFLFDPGV
jgi:hypothetical protein